MQNAGAKGIFGNFQQIYLPELKKWLRRYSGLLFKYTKLKLFWLIFVTKRHKIGWPEYRPICNGYKFPIFEKLFIKLCHNSSNRTTVSCFSLFTSGSIVPSAFFDDTFKKSAFLVKNTCQFHDFLEKIKNASEISSFLFGNIINYQDYETRTETLHLFCCEFPTTQSCQLLKFS